MSVSKQIRWFLRDAALGGIGIFVAARIFTPTDRLHTKSPMASNRH